jgi:hypothetical protein
LQSETDNTPISLFQSVIIIPSLNMTTSLDQLKQTGTVVVSDSGDFECAPWSFSECITHITYTE